MRLALMTVDDMEEYEEEDEEEDDEADEAERDEEEEETGVPDDRVDVGASGEDKLPPVTEKDTDE
jgi:Ran GTPase-activating protein 1